MNRTAAPARLAEGLSVAFIVPGRLDQLTGGYLYDAAIIAELRAQGATVQVYELAGSFPIPDTKAREAARSVWDRVISGRGADIAVIDGLGLPAFDGLLGSQTVPVTALIHHPLAKETGLSPTLSSRLYDDERSALSHCDQVITSSAYTRDVLVRDYAVPWSRSIAIAPGTPPLRPIARRPGRTVRLLSVGTLTARKAHHRLIDATRSLPVAGWSLTIVGGRRGDRAEERRVARAMARTGRRRVHLSGEVDARTLWRSFRRADVFALASVYEGYGIAFAEALRLGLPILCTTGGAIPWTVPRTAGWRVAPGDRRALRVALRQAVRADRIWRMKRAGARAAGRALPVWRESGARFAAALQSVRKQLEAERGRI